MGKIKHMTIIGAGGVGCAFVVALAGEQWIQEGWSADIFDPDVFGPENMINQILCSAGTVGGPKADVAVECLLRACSETAVIRSFARPFDSRCPFGQVVVSAVDSKEARLMIVERLFNAHASAAERPDLYLDLCLSYADPDWYGVEVAYDCRVPDKHLGPYLSRLNAKHEADATALAHPGRRDNRPACMALASLAVTMLRLYIDGEALPYFADGHLRQCIRSFVDDMEE